MSRSRVFNAYFNILTEESADSVIEKLFSSNDAIKWYRAQLEVTENKQLHLQAVWGYASARTLSSVQKFMGSTTQVTKDSDAMVQYCTDERKRFNNKLWSNGEFQLRSKTDVIDELLERACKLDSYEAAMKLVEEGNRRYFISQQKQLGAYFKKFFGVRDIVLYNLDQFTVQPIPKDILAEKTIILHGGSAYGKTSFAMAHFEHPAIIKSKLDYPKINDDTDGIIFDDMNLSNWSTSAVKNITDLSVDSFQDIKYSSILLKKNLPRFICINNEAQFWPKELFDYDNKTVKEQSINDLEAISRRTHFMKVDKPLFNRKRKQEDIVKNEGSDVITRTLASKRFSPNVVDTLINEL